MKKMYGKIFNKRITFQQEVNQKDYLFLNIDWDNIHAKDLFILFSSFCKGGQSRIVKVEVFPSQFGIEQLEKEKTEGPDRDIFEDTKRRGNANKVVHGLDDVLQEEENEDFTGFNQVKLRKYEMKRLKYYYAVITCDSVETAANIYNECDGMEIERTQSILDIRYVPDDLKKFPYPPKEVCTGDQDLDLKDYQPNLGNNRALGHSKVKLTWDTNDQRRDDILAKAFKKGQFKEEEINDLIASSDSEDDEDALDFAESFKKNVSTNEDNNDIKLLKRKKNNNPLDIKEGQEIEITFNKGLENLADSNGKPIASFKTKNVDPKDSQFEKYKAKKKEKKTEKKLEEKKKKDKIKKMRNKDYSEESEIESENGTSSGESMVDADDSDKEEATKAELELLFNNDDNNKFNFNKKDNRFKAVYGDKNYAIDPTDSNFKKSNKVVEAVKDSKVKKRKKFKSDKDN